jgi:phosphoribosylformylglycinamidine cyclo-ligase
VHAFAHVTGGGLAGNLVRVLPHGLRAVVDRTTWSPPAIFALVGALGSVAGPELEKALNQGVGMLAVVAPTGAARSLALLADRGVPAWVCGEVEATPGRPAEAELVGAHPGGGA